MTPVYCYSYIWLTKSKIVNSKLFETQTLKEISFWFKIKSIKNFISAMSTYSKMKPWINHFSRYLKASKNELCNVQEFKDDTKVSIIILWYYHLKLLTCYKMLSQLQTDHFDIWIDPKSGAYLISLLNQERSDDHFQKILIRCSDNRDNLRSRRWNWKFWKKHFWNPNPELLLNSSYSFWP